jgi:hypothetical protein
MKNKAIINNFFLVFISLLIGVSTIAQTAKKNTVRLKIEYIKIMQGEVLFNVKASSRVDRKNVNLANISLSFFNEVNDESLILGTTTTDANGKGKLTIENINSIQPDSTQIYTIKATFKGDDSFKKASKSISFKNANINAKIVTKDSINYIEATLFDTATNTPLGNESLGVQVQRLFKPLQIEEFNITNETGTILVPIPKNIPGIDGVLNIEVILNDSDEFGTVKALVKAPVGIPIVDESTFDQRTMWSPRNKTPLFLLIFPNILIFGIWGLIIYLFINLFKITKS